MELITIEDAKKHLRDNVYEGTRCPCCQSYVKAQPRSLSYTTVKPLEILYNLSKGKIGVYISKDEIYALYPKKSYNIGF